MTNVKTLPGVVMPAALGEPQEAVIKMIESLLQRARSGELQSLVGCGFTADGARLSIWAGHHQNVYEMLGNLAWLQHEYVDRITGRAE